MYDIESALRRRAMMERLDALRRAEASTSTQEGAAPPGPANGTAGDPAEGPGAGGAPGPVGPVGPVGVGGLAGAAAGHGPQGYPAPEYASREYAAPEPPAAPYPSPGYAPEYPSTGYPSPGYAAPPPPAPATPIGPIAAADGGPGLNGSLSGFGAPVAGGTAPLGTPALGAPPGSTPPAGAGSGIVGWAARPRHRTGAPGERRPEPAFPQAPSEPTAALSSPGQPRAGARGGVEAAEAEMPPSPYMTPSAPLPPDGYGGLPRPARVDLPAEHVIDNTARPAFVDPPRPTSFAEAAAGYTAARTAPVPPPVTPQTPQTPQSPQGDEDPADAAARPPAAGTAASAIADLLRQGGSGLFFTGDEDDEA